MNERFFVFVRRLRTAPVAVWMAFVFCTAGIGAAERRAQRFQPVPRDVSTQPLPPDKTGKIEFIGARNFADDKLREALADQIREINEQGLTPPRADDAAYYLAVFYRKQGYADVEVNWDIRGSRLVLRIVEGPRVFVRKVHFTGNRAITDSVLRDYMVGATEERLRNEPSAFPFVRADITTGAARVRGLYESEGFLNAVVDEPKIEVSGERADISLHITEGQRYTFGKITFEGNPLFPREELLTGMEGRFNVPYTTQQLNTMTRNLVFFYKARGYHQAEVTVAADPAKAVEGRVAVIFTVKPHQMFRFNGVSVRGLDRLRPDFLPQRFAELKGQVYNPEKLDEKYRELLHTGLFKNLRINSVPQSDDTIRIDLTVEEAKAKEVGFSIGAGSYEGVILGLRLGDRNIFGSGRPLSLDLDYSTRGMRGELLYVDPWFFESDFSLRARLFAQSRDEEGYSKQEVGLRADLLRKLSKNVELGVFAEVKNVEITEAFIEPQLLGPTSYQIGTMGLTQSFDFRNNPINPSKGWIITTALDFDSIAGDVAFGRATLRLSYYVPLSPKLLLALGARGGLIYPFADVPIDERYFSGGANTVRSFRERDLGPKDRHGYPVGGQAFTVFNAELNFPIAGALQGAVFVDAGNVIADFANAGVQDMRYAVGVGLRYKLPIGPVRLDFGLNPAPRQDEDFGAFHFSIGFAF